MSQSNESSEIQNSYNKSIWPIYLVSGFNSIAFGGLIILIVPLSSLFWPGEPYHAIEMGVLLTSLMWVSSITGIIFGWLIDKYSRVKTLLIISVVRSVSMIMLGFATEGQGFNTWLYFLIFIIIFATFAGGSYPSIVSLANDIVPLKKRSQFFGYFSIVGSIFSMIGFIISGFLVEYGFWRLYFIIVGLGVLFAGILFVIIVKEPKRGSQNKELKQVLKEDSVEYDFKMNKEMMKKTMFSGTNLAALIEGIFSGVFMGSLDMTILPYLQTPPHNLSPLTTGLFIVIFGLIGRVLGQIWLARVSDKASAKKDIRRIYFIIISLVGGSVTYLFMFFIPLPILTPEQGSNFNLFFSFPTTYIIGCCIIGSFGLSSLYGVNQPPVIQEINLPEAQGKIISWNQFLERIGYGMGPLISGIFITFFQQNYLISSIVITLFTIPGIILWILAVNWYPSDKKEISKILSSRAEILNSR